MPDVAPKERLAPLRVTLMQSPHETIRDRIKRIAHEIDAQLNKEEEMEKAKDNAPNSLNFSSQGLRRMGLSPQKREILPFKKLP